MNNHACKVKNKVCERYVGHAFSVKHLYGHGRNECDGEIGVLNTAELMELSLVNNKLVINNTENLFKIL